MARLINDINGLRNILLQAIDDLKDRKITSEEASALSKLSTNILATVKIQVEYARLNGEKMAIPFMIDNNTNIIDAEDVNETVKPQDPNQLVFKRA